MKTCNKYSKWLTLYVLGELTEKEKTEYEEHLKSCPICSADVEEERTFTAKLKRTPKIDVSSELLEECRSELRYRLRAEKRKQQLNWWSVITKSMMRLTSPKFALVTITATLIIGIIIGRNTTPPREAELVSQANEDRIMNISDLQYDPETNQIEVRFNTVKDVYVKGTPDDETIRRVLAYSLQNPTSTGLRIRAVNALSTQPVGGSLIETALIYALENDENAGVRLKAAKVLSEMPINELIKNTFIRVMLKDINSAVRMEAVEALSKVKEESVKPAMQRAARRDENEYVRLKASQTLERLEDSTQ